MEIKIGDTFRNDYGELIQVYNAFLYDNPSPKELMLVITDGKNTTYTKLSQRHFISFVECGSLSYLGNYENILNNEEVFNTLKALYL